MTKDTNINKPAFWIISSLTILLGGLFAFINLTEWYTIGILNKTEGYPFGGEVPTPYYYKSAYMYSKVNLLWGLLFLSTTAFGTWTILKGQKIRTLLIFGLTLLLLIAMFVHGSLGVY